jgi:hypothetical protein
MTARRGPRRLAVIALALGPLLAGVAGCAAPPSGPPAFGWAEDWERERCIRDGNWWRPNDKLGGGGRCDKVNMER